jgi:hypothetical protein
MHVEYCRWFRDVITANGEDILDIIFFIDEAFSFIQLFWMSHFLPMRHGFIHLVMSTAAFVSDLSTWNQQYTTTWSEGWCVVHHIMKSDNWPHILWGHYQLGTLLWSDSLLLHWTFKKDKIACSYFQQDGTTAHTVRVSMTLLRDVFGDRIISKDIWPPRAPDVTTTIICGEQQKAQFTKTILTLSLNWRMPLQIPLGTSLRLNCRMSLQICTCVSTSMWGAISNICCNLSKYENYICKNVQGLSEYSHRLQ